MSSCGEFSIEKAVRYEVNGHLYTHYMDVYDCCMNAISRGDRNCVIHERRGYEVLMEKEILGFFYTKKEAEAFFKRTLADS